MFEKLISRAVACMEVGSPCRGIIMALTAFVLLLILKKILRHRLAAYIRLQAQKEENVENFLRGYDVVFKILLGIAVIIAAGGSFGYLGLSIGFLGTVLGWSLQVPIRGLAAWVMVVLKRPFKIGDRIAVAGVVGDVINVQLNHIVLNQVGGTVQGEEKSGRGILVPTAMLFGENIINYNYFAQQTEQQPAPASQFMLDEVLVRITFGSDYDFAKQLCIDVTREAVQELIGETDEDPFTRVEFMAWGILLRVRYKTIPNRRQELSSLLTERLWAAILGHRDKVRFAMPGSVNTVLRPEDGTPPPMARGSEQPAR